MTCWFILHDQNGKTEELPIYSDNLPTYKGAVSPFVSPKFFVEARQPYGYFKGFLQLRQCQYFDENQQCPEITPIQPYCRKHLLEILHLDVKTSTIKGAGNGLFAYSNTKFNENDNQIVFKENQFIYSFHGELLSMSELKHRYQANLDTSSSKDQWFTPYAACLDATNVVDSIVIRGVMSMANDPRDTNKVNTYEVVGTEDGKRVIKVYASRNIRDNDEIFINYGKPFWWSFPKDI